jgi:hypothetical protein
MRPYHAAIHSLLQPTFRLSVFGLCFFNVPFPLHIFSVTAPHFFPFSGAGVC